MSRTKNTVFKAAIFDLDGVVVDTVPLHFKAWKQMFEEYGKKFTFQDYKDKVDGIPRIDGGRAILTDLTDDELDGATSKKQGYFLEYLKKDKIKVFKPTLRLIKELRGRGIKIAVISSSKNLPFILEKIGILKLLDAKISGSEITKGKPHPQIFLMAAEKIGVKPENCIVFEDAVLGAIAAKRAKMLCIGIDRYNDPSRLKDADLISVDLEDINFDKLSRLFKRLG
ncbi:MAG: beta-phosphoglucomutase family hydrolase [Candidatus Hydrothermarchaeaceae archaeon]